MQKKNEVDIIYSNSLSHKFLIISLLLNGEKMLKVCAKATLKLIRKQYEIRDCVVGRKRNKGATLAHSIEQTGVTEAQKGRD